MVINLTQYVLTLGQQYTLFRFASDSMAAFKTRPPEFKKFIKDEAERLSKAIHTEKFSQADRLPTTQLLKSLCTFLEEQSVMDDQKQLDILLLRHRQQAVIFFHASLEALLREILRELLQKNPEKLKADRKIDLGKLIAGSKEEILRDEIEKQINIFDRSSVEDRAAFFKDRFDIIWGRFWTEAFKALNSFRQEILHQNVDRIVTEDDVDVGLVIALLLGWSICMQGWYNYPECFDVRWTDRKEVEAAVRPFRQT